MLKRDMKKSEPRSRDTPVGQRSLRVIYILSDSTGNLPAHLVNALLTQFPVGSFDVRLRNFLDSPVKLRGVLDEIVAGPGIVFHAVVSSKIKQQINGVCLGSDLPVSDVTGGFMQFLAWNSGIDPTNDVKRVHDLDLDPRYDKRISAIEFTLGHDDGLGLNTLDEADVILVGVSRTSKTPTSIYLAQQGYKVCNVALAMQVPPPEELLRQPVSKVVAFVIDPARLARIRSRRQSDWGMADTSYNDEEQVRKEVQWSKRLFIERGWHTIDVTNTAIEETAARVIEVLKLGRK